MYLTFDEYKEMGGTLDEVAFDDFAFEAATIVNWYTFNRLEKMTEWPDKVKRCMFVLIRLAKLKADAMALGAQQLTKTDSHGVTTTTIIGEPVIASQSNDGVSTSYNMVSASEAFRNLQMSEAGNEIEMTVQRYLQGVVDSLGRKVLYRGVYEDE